MAYLELQQLDKSFGTTQVLKDINLNIERGEFVVFVGASGCGKSTLLRCIAGLETPSGGDVRLEGQSILHRDPKDRDVAMVFQNYALYPHMNVYDNLAFGLKMRKTPKAEIEQKVREAAELLGLAELLKRKPGELSGGQCQRVALGRAIVRKPKLFMMDEPLSNLDAQLRQHMRQELRALHERLGATTLYVTHDQTETLTLADKVVVLDRGSVSQCAPPTVLYQQPANTYVAKFIAQMNFLTLRRESPEAVTVLDAHGTTLREGLALPAGFELLFTQADDETVLLGVRPEHLSLALENPPKEEGFTLPLHLVQRELHGPHQTLRFAPQPNAEPVLVSQQPFHGEGLSAGDASVLHCHIGWPDVQFFNPKTQARLHHEPMPV